MVRFLHAIGVTERFCALAFSHETVPGEGRQLALQMRDDLVQHTQRMVLFVDAILLFSELFAPHGVRMHELMMFFTHAYAVLHRVGPTFADGHDMVVMFNGIFAEDAVPVL